jgi:hypothetical protein
MKDAERLVGYAADIWAALKGIAAVLDGWVAAPNTGVIRMAQTETPTPIPANDCPAVVQWFDRLGAEIDHSATDTTWSAEDGTGAPTAVVTINPAMDADNIEETATVVFAQSSGQFRVVATTPGAGGTSVRAQSVVYEITPGAPAVGKITLTPA